MTPEIAAKTVNLRFKGQPDRWGRWRVLTARKGPLNGDCEDYALTVAWYIAGKSWIRLIWHLLICRSVIWYCLDARTNRPHAVLWHRGAGWVDNIWPYWEAKTDHRRLFPILHPLLLIVAIYSLLASVLAVFFRAR